MTLLGMLLNLGTDKNNSGQQQYCRVVQKSFFEAPFSQFKVNIIINYHTRCFAVNSIITIYRLETHLDKCLFLCCEHMDLCV